jgi:hypothetical protein
MPDDKCVLPQFRVLKRGEQPPDGEHHVLLVHRISQDKRALVHEIVCRLPRPAGAAHDMTGANAFSGSPGDALRLADQIATAHGATFVYVRDDTPNG